MKFGLSVPNGRREAQQTATADKTESARAVGPLVRAPGPAASRRRWVPPSSVRRSPAPSGDTHDAVLRKVRGILNKLTPEKFRKLSDDLLALQLDSDKVFKGVILLIFEKALDEPKYSSMYAQLCRRLSEDAPNLEPPGQPCTFNLLLLNKCRTEFENRAEAFAAFEGRALAPDDQERRHLAKCKMLGNIKFIGELGKLEILSESILHRCIQQLLARRGGDRHEDLECLAQLVRTCGRVLDSPRGRGLMDQYFARMQTLSQARELAPRIRFMLRDVVELRRGGWVPRAAAAASAEGPVPIQQLRGDDDFRAPPPDPGPGRSLFRRARGLEDVLSGLSLTAPAAPLAPPPAPLFSRPHRGRPALRDPPRTKPRPPAAPAALDDLQMRPAANSLLFTANRLSRQPLAAPPTPAHFASPAAAPTALKEPTIAIRPATATKPKKERGPAKEEACRLAIEAARAEAAEGPALEADEPCEGFRSAAADDAVRRLLATQPPEKVLRRVVAALLELALQTPAVEPLGSSEPTAGPALARACCAVLRAVKRAPLGDTVRALLPAHNADPAMHDLVAALVSQGLISLGEAGGWTAGGAHHPLLLEVLARLRAASGADRVRAQLAAAGLQLAACLPPGAELADEVEPRGLADLVPQLRLQARLARALRDDPAPAALYRWIKTNVEPATRGDAAFVSALVGLLAAHVAERAPEPEPERALVEAYAPLLGALLAARPDLQLAAVYAVQVHAHQRRYPKGLLLRWFMYLYNLEVVEEEAFLRWREDVTDAYPGKGEALFQVNAWLTWLQQQDSEDEETDD